MRRITPQRHGQSELLIPDNQKSSFTAINEVSSGAMDIAFDPVVPAVNTFVGPGKFGKMFPNSTPFQPAKDDGLTALAEAMNEPGGDDAKNDSKIPSGFTYLGQFVDHDITFDKTSGFPATTINDPATIEQGRTPNLDLDSLYGFGPGELDGDMFEGALGSEVFKLGKTSPVSDSSINPSEFPNDLFREGKKALIPDHRNDENLIVAQTHLAFLKFHNKLISILPPSKAGEPSLFERTRQLVTWHYQWIVLHDFVKRLVQKKVFDDVLKKGRKFYKFENSPDKKPFMPLEFSVAAYRLGHSMIRAVYDHNRVFPSAGLDLIFLFSGSNAQSIVPVPSNWIIDWRRFFEVGKFGGVGDFKGKINHARKIDTKITDPLRTLDIFKKVDEPPPSLAQRNILRGSRVGLPTGQEVAQLMNIAKPLTAKELASGSSGQVVKDNAFDKETPLWFYILKEAEMREKGERLGELGSRIVMEVFFGLLEGDPNSFINKKWKPSDSQVIPKQKPKEFTMADMLLFVGDISPIDGIRG